MFDQKSSPADRAAFLSEETVKKMLKDMEADKSLNTSSTLVKDKEGFVWSVSFYERHLTYLQGHPKVDPKKYLTNLKTMAKTRP